MSYYEQRRAEILNGRSRKVRAGVAQRAKMRAKVKRMLYARQFAWPQLVRRNAAIRVALAIGVPP